MTPLHVAAKSARFQVVEYLIDQGAYINTKDSDGVSIYCWMNFFLLIDPGKKKNENLHLHNLIKYLGFVMH